MKCQPFRQAWGPVGLSSHGERALKSGRLPSANLDCSSLSLQGESYIGSQGLEICGLRRVEGCLLGAGKHRIISYLEIPCIFLYAFIQ
jgi:hypothetical protein